MRSDNQQLKSMLLEDADILWFLKHFNAKLKVSDEMGVEFLFSTQDARKASVIHHMSLHLTASSLVSRGLEKPHDVSIKLLTNSFAKIRELTQRFKSLEAQKELDTRLSDLKQQMELRK